MNGFKKLLVFFVALVMAAMFWWRRPVTAPSAMRGLWQSPCRGPGAGHAAPWRIIVDRRYPVVETYYILYKDARCQEPGYANRSSAVETFFRVWRKPDTFSLDTTYKEFFNACLDQQCLKNFNQLKLYGYSQWELYKENEVTGRSPRPGEPVMAKDSIQYDIVRLLEGRLNYGSNQTGDTTSAKNRPTEFEEADLALVKIPDLPDYLKRVQRAPTKFQ